MDRKRKVARELATRHLEQNDFLGWFEALYETACGDTGIIPWADGRPNPNLVRWLDREKIFGHGKKALKIGCGLGDDAEELARRGFRVTGFDISKTAVDWCRSRFPRSPVTYVTADLLAAPSEWQDAFDFVLESYTLQVLPPVLRSRTIRCVSRFVAAGGTLLVICRGRDSGEDPGKMPWPLLRPELDEFRSCGMDEVFFEDFTDAEDPPVRRFRVTYRRR